MVLLSESLPVTSGVPQGSVLGPLFFFVFLDDMIDVPEVSKVICYADDTKLLCHGELCLNSAQNDLSSLRLWAYCNYLSFNSAKRGYLHISRMSLDNILLGDVEIPSLDNITDLGIEVSKTLKWSLPIQTKIVKACRSFNYLKHSVPFNLPSGVKFNLFEACVLSVLLYGYIAWFPEISDLRKLEQLNIHWPALVLWLQWLLLPAKIIQLSANMLSTHRAWHTCFYGNHKQRELHIFWQILQLGLKGFKPTSTWSWTSGAHTS